MNQLIEKRKDEIKSSPDRAILGKAYYVSNSGCDDFDGKTPDTPIKTLEKLSALPVKEGDSVLFCRGSLFRGEVSVVSEVFYGAYGEGEKPKLYGWYENLADVSLWEEAFPGIWKYTKEIFDVGTLVFNDGEKVSRKLIPSYIKGRFVCRNDESKAFEIKEEMTENLDIYWHYEKSFTEYLLELSI